jgi:hypothetical protein
MESLKDKLTEEGARELLNDIYFNDTYMGLERLLHDCEIIDFINTWKEKGYIKQNPVERAEELLEELNRVNKGILIKICPNTLEIIIDAFNYLKKGQNIDIKV